MLRRAVQLVVDLILGLPLVLASVLSRWFAPRPIDVGIGPQPLVSAPHHKRALELHGVSAETFVGSVYFITDDFDVRFDRLPRPARVLRPHLMFLWAIWRYRCLLLHFDGGPLGFQPLLGRFEPALLRLAGVRTVMLAYGGDVQVLTRSRNLPFRHASAVDYPRVRFRQRLLSRKIDLWTRWADHVVSGCDWVDYMPYWDTLMLAHFAIDTEAWAPSSRPAPPGRRPLRILHAPNHRALKGTQAFIDAVDELRDEGLALELVLLERSPRHRIREAMADVDVVADQLVIGWYAMFAIEAMAMGKPVLCHLRTDLLDLYEGAVLVQPGEVPLVNCDRRSVKSAIRRLYEEPAFREECGQRGRRFVERHHSEQAVGATLSRIVRDVLQ